MSISHAEAGGAGCERPALSFFLLMWQVPHSWLLALRTSGDYEQAQFPTFVRAIGAEPMARVTFMWTTATAASALSTMRQ